MASLTREQLAIRDMTRDFVRKEVAPHAARWDRTATVPLLTVHRAGGGLSCDAMSIAIVSAPVSLGDLRRMAAEQFGDFVKAVVDVRQGLMAIGGELHADEEAALLEHGARQVDLWGINLHPDRPGDELVEFDSMINVRPAQGNRSRGVDDPARQRQIIEVVMRLVIP